MTKQLAMGIVLVAVFAVAFASEMDNGWTVELERHRMSNEAIFPSGDSCIEAIQTRAGVKEIRTDRPREFRGTTSAGLGFFCIKYGDPGTPFWIGRYSELLPFGSANDGRIVFHQFYTPRYIGEFSSRDSCVEAVRRRVGTGTIVMEELGAVKGATSHAGHFFLCFVWQTPEQFETGNSEGLWRGFYSAPKTIGWSRQLFFHQATGISILSSQDFHSRDSCLEAVGANVGSQMIELEELDMSESPELAMGETEDGRSFSCHFVVTDTGTGGGAWQGTYTEPITYRPPGNVTRIRVFNTSEASWDFRSRESCLEAVRAEAGVETIAHDGPDMVVGNTSGGYPFLCHFELEFEQVNTGTRRGIWSGSYIAEESAE